MFDFFGCFKVKGVVSKVKFESLGQLVGREKGRKEGRREWQEGIEEGRNEMR